MTTQVGSTVHILGWDSLHGSYVDEYEVAELTADFIALKHLATYRGKERLPGTGDVQRRVPGLLSYFDIPLSERLREHRDSIDWLAKTFGDV